MINQGKKLKLAIKGKGLTVEAAAKTLSISRQTLQGYYNQYQLPEDIVSDVKTKLSIDLLDDYQESESELKILQDKYDKVLREVGEIKSDMVLLKDYVTMLRTELKSLRSGK